MFRFSISIGPVNVELETDDNLSFDAIDSLLNRGAATSLTLFDEHLSSVLKYENFDNDIDCDVCEAIEKLD
jgi:hypothetical protein